MNILEIGAGKSSLKDKLYKDNLYIKIDIGYKISLSENDQIDVISEAMTKNENGLLICNMNLYDFMDSFPFRFDKIIGNRIFEHQEYVGNESVGRLLEACNKLLEDDGTLEIIVPNAKKLAQMVLDFENLPLDDCSLQYAEIANNALVINTEFTNGKFDPHASIWSPALAKYMIESEGIWHIKSITDIDNYAGRSIYMKIIATKESNETSK